MKTEQEIKDKALEKEKEALQIPDPDTWKRMDMELFENFKTIAYIRGWLECSQWVLK